MDEKDEEHSRAVTQLYVLWERQAWHCGNGAQRIPVERSEAGLGEGAGCRGLGAGRRAKARAEAGAGRPLSSGWETVLHPEGKNSPC